jgi:type III restriction enzyme
MVLNDMELKNYQQDLLETFGRFLSRTREQKSAAFAFHEGTATCFGHALPYVPLPGAEEVPYVCLRVPTGGGKTRIAGQAIARVNHDFLAAEYTLTLWLVPSEPIREQTLYALKTPGELLHEDMRALFGGVNVLDIREALYLRPATLNSGNTIIVATMQSFKRDNAEGLRVYRQNGALQSHFEGVSEAQKGEGSVVDAIRLRRPFIIVDEAHNQGTPLATETLVRLAPSAILELTATPDRLRQPSNVLASVSAAILQAEDMLKLPLELATHPDWRVSLSEAIARVRQLEQEAEEEERATGERIHPVVMLIQAERNIQGKAAFTPDVVKRHLIDDFQIPPESIAIATGQLDELGDKRLDTPGFPQFIITVDKLREGWDCPYAYVLYSFRNTTSATAVEQVLGRVLRMPHVRRKTREALNRAYAYVVSSDFAATVQGLKDGLVQSGFERLETDQLIHARTEDLFTPSADLTIPLPEMPSSSPEAVGALALPQADRLNELPRALREKIDLSFEAGTLTVKGGANAREIRQIAEIFPTPEAARLVRERLDTLAQNQSLPQREKTPAEKGESAKVPLLSMRQLGFFDLFDETALLDADWEIDTFDGRLSEKEFTQDKEAMRRASLSLSELEKIQCNLFDRMDSQLALFGGETSWQTTDLVYWLDRNLDFPYAERAQKVAWLNAAMDWLLEERHFTLEELAYRKFRLRGALERKLAAGLKLAKQRVFDGLFDDESCFEVRDEHAIVLEAGRYAYDMPYVGMIPLRRHFFPVIGNLKEQGEEFKCAEFIANELEGIEWWIRNVEKKPSSFWLQTASDKFYPDFIVRTQSGVTLAVEYKGAHLAATDDSKEKKRIGELWARRSNGRCRFVWVEEQNWRVIREAVQCSSTPNIPVS